MILYDKTGTFLGMGSQELYLLGYEDMDEFNEYHNDFADLFINKSGFIFKFQNFSWIDYVLHGGDHNRKVLIQAKNGKAIEALLEIHEIFLTQEIHGASVCFGVALKTNAGTHEPLPKIELPVEENTLVPTQYENINQIQPNDLDAIDIAMPFQKNTNPNDHSLFDLASSGESLELDMSLLAQLLGEYLEELEKQVPKIEHMVEIGDWQSVREETIKLKSVAGYLEITSIYEALETIEKNLTSLHPSNHIPMSIMDLKKAIDRFKENINA